MSVKTVRKKPAPKKLAPAKARSAQTRRERVAFKEDAITAAAYEMFATLGFAGTTVSEIAKKAGVAEGTLYLYFANKESIARAVLAAFYGNLTQSAQAGVETLNTTEAQLAFLARHHLESILKERRLLELLSILDRDIDTYEGSEIYKMNRAYVAVFDGVIRDGVLRGDIEDGFTPWIIRDIFYGGLDYAMRTILIKRREDSINQFIEELVRLLTGALNASRRPTAKISNRDLAKIADRVEAAAERLEMMAAAKPAALKKRRK